MVVNFSLLFMLLLGLLLTLIYVEPSTIEEVIAQHNCQTTGINCKHTINRHDLQKRTCDPKVTLQRCNTGSDDDDPRWFWRRFLEYTIYGIAENACQSSNLHYNWMLFDHDNNFIGEVTEFKNKPIFILRYYQLDTGFYKLILHVKEVSKDGEGETYAICHINIVPEEPVPVIDGGESRTVPSGVNFSLVGDKSINNDVPPWEQAFLKFRWSCKVQPANSFCKSKLSKWSRLEVPALFAIDNSKYWFRMEVSTEHFSWIPTQQIVTVKKGARNIYISCEKNCESKINYRSNIFLHAKCDDCFQNGTYKWSMTPGPNNQKTSIDFAKETAYGVSDPKLVINQNVMVPGDTYSFLVVYKGKFDGEASTKIKIATLPKKGTCTVEPSEGKSVTTFFTIICQGFVHTNALTYKLFQRDLEMGGEGILLATNEEGRFRLYLSASKGNSVKLLIRTGDADGLYIEEELTVSVTSLIANLPPDQQFRKLMDEYAGKNSKHQSVQALIKKGDTETVIQMINSLTSEVRHISKDAPKYKENKQKWKSMVINNLERLSWESQDALLQVAAIIKNLKWEDKDEVEREFGVAAARICRKIAEKQIDSINEAPYKDKLAENTIALSQDVLWCADTTMKPNLTDLIPVPVVFNLTTAFPELTLPKIPENYANYDDADLECAKKLKDYQDITASAIDAFNLMGVAIAKTLTSGEPTRQIDNHTNVIQIATDEAQLLSKKRLGGYKSFVYAPKDLAKFKSSEAFGVVTVFAKNPFWWEQDSKQLAAHVLNVDYYMAKKKVRNLREPMEMVFEVEKIESDLIDSSVSVPADLDKWVPEMLDYNMTVHRVDVRKGAALMISFVGLSGNDRLQVVVLHNRRPHTVDFRKATDITTENATLLSVFPKGLLKFGDAWLYIAVLPDRKMVKDLANGTFTYNFSMSFVSPYCVYWKKSWKKWVSDDCWTGPNTTKSQLHCFCLHRSAYSRIYQNAPNKIDKILNVTYVLSMEPSQVIFICVCAVFLIYCIALTYGIKMSKTRSKTVYFLSDNVENERYAYLIIIKTGNMRSAGTTSNVGVKLFGKKCNSRAHIVNFPDPDMRLLQKGSNDWFVLATETYLGELQHLYLWHDSLGHRPSWYCDYVKVVDLQKSEEWFFDVKTWLSVLKEEHRHLEVKPTITKINSRKRKTTLIKLEELWASLQNQHSWNICKSQERNDLSYIQRITIVLSVIVTTYSFALILYGTPVMRVRDGLGYGHYTIYPLTLMVALISSLMSFFLNLPFAIVFRRPPQQSLKDKKQRFLAWLVLISTIVACVTFLMVFGFWVPYVTSLLWVTSSLGALIQSVVLVENLYLLCRTWIWPKPSNVSEPDLTKPQVVQDAEEQRSKLFGLFGDGLLRSYFSKKYRPLTREEWKVKKEQELIRLRLAELVQDLVMFSAYIVLLYVVVLANKDSLDIYGHQEMKRLVYGENTENGFEDIKTVEDFYEYINQTFIPTIHSMNWYGEWEFVEPGLMADFNIKILGVARFRQLRVCKNCCQLPRSIKRLNMTCFPEFSYWNNDVGEYMEHWLPKTFVLVERLIGAWSYRQDARPSIGDMAVYTGGGYSAPLGRSMFNSYYNLRYYMNATWVDKRTRVIFVEFLTYNANYNIFHAVRLMVEKSASGLFTKTHSISTTRLLFVKLELQTMTLTVFAIFILMIFIMLFKSFYNAVQNWKQFFKQRWNLVDVVIILLSFVCVGLYSHRSHLVGRFLHELESSQHNKFLSYFHLIYLDEALTLVASVLICVATIRLWKLLRFGLVFRIMEQTLVLSARPLIAIIVCHLIIILMYSFTGYLIFGASYCYFRHLPESFTTMVLLSLGLHAHFDPNFLRETYGGLGYAFYTSYMLITLTVVTLYVAAITMSYGESCTVFSAYTPSVSVPKYARNELQYYRELIGKRLKRVRLAGGGDELGQEIFKKKVTPKSDEHRYADAVVVPTYRLYVMGLVARCVVFNFAQGRTKKVLSRTQVDLMRKVVVHLVNQQEHPEPKSVAFTGYEGDKLKFISDNTLLKMEYVVGYILDRGTARNSQVVSFDEYVQQASPAGLSEANEQLEYFEDVLKSILRVFNNIKIGELEDL